MSEPAELLKCTMAECEEPRADQDPKATNRHCKKCRAESTRKWREGVMDQAARRSFVKGVNALRKILVEEFRGQGNGRFTGVEIAKLIERAPGPLVESEFENSHAPAEAATS